MDKNTDIVKQHLEKCIVDVEVSSLDENQSIVGAIIILIDKVSSSRITIAGEMHKQVAMGCCLEAANIVDNKTKEDEARQIYEGAIAQFEKFASGASEQ